MKFDLANFSSQSSPYYLKFLKSIYVVFFWSLHGYMTTPKTFIMPKFDWPNSSTDLRYIYNTTDISSMIYLQWTIIGPSLSGGCTWERTFCIKSIITSFCTLAEKSFQFRKWKCLTVLTLSPWNYEVKVKWSCVIVFVFYARWL